jgi:LuxR family maltose regulon positive regulatory protein
MEPQLILPTKLYIPPSRPEIVIRKNLLNLINDNFRFKTILVAAPAGFGKTTLVCNWIRQLNTPVAWFSIGEGDNDPVIFFSYLISSLQTVDPKIGASALPMLQAPDTDYKVVLTRLIQDIDQRGEELILVLDDYHCIKEKEIHNLIEFLINHKPGRFHLVISSRSDPLLPLHRYRGNNQLTEIRSRDLSFSNDEAYTFFNKVMGLNLSTENVTDLNKRTEGWITGLQMAALSLKSHDDIDGFIQSFAGDNRYVMDYLLEEVIAVQTEEVKSFLLHTSILDRFSRDLCEAVTGIATCQEIIDILDRENLFLVALDNKKVWYRYHHLFAHLLRKKLRETQPDIVPQLHLKASQWFAENDLVYEAIDHSVFAEDWNTASLYVERMFMERMVGGEDFDTMLDKLRALPEEMICSRPSLCVMYGWMHSLVLQLEDAEIYLQLVEEKEGADLDQNLKMQIEVIRAEMARYRGDLRYSINSSLDTLNRIKNNPSGNPLQMQNYTGSTMSLAWSYYLAGEVDMAYEKFRESINISEEIGSITLFLLNLKGLAETCMLQCRLKEAGEIFRDGLRRIKKSTQPFGHLPSAAAYIYLDYGNYLRELNQFEDAGHYLEEGLKLGINRRIDGNTLRDGFIHLARLKHGQNDLEGLLKIFNEADQVLEAYFKIDSFRDPLDICKATLVFLSLQGSKDKVRVKEKNLLQKWIDSQDIKSNPEVYSITEELRYLLWSRWLIYRKKLREALELLDHLLNQANMNGRMERVITIRILQAIAYEASGDSQKSLQSLCQAVNMAQPEGYFRIFVDEGENVSGLLKKLVSAQVLDEEGNTILVPMNYLKKLILSFESDKKQISFTELTDPLSSREQDVLLMLSTGLSNNEIAEKLFISKDTVKSHLKNINVKLNTSNRIQAVERARELGLF